MATYNEAIYPRKMFLVNLLDGSERESSDSSVSVRAYGTFYGKALQQWLEVDSVRFEFDYSESAYASSKNLKTADATLHVRLTSAYADITGDYPRGRPEARLENWRNTPLSRLATGMGSGMVSDPTPRWLDLYLNYNDEILGISEVGMTDTVYSYEDYTFDAEFTVNGIGSTSYKPYRNVVWEDIVPTLGGFAPSGGAFINRAAAQTFTFSVNVANAYDGTVLGRTITFRWRVAGSGTTHAISVSGQSVTVPANTFPAQSAIEWRVECVTSDGISATSEWQRIITTDAVPLAPINLVPKNVFLHNDEDNVFSWTHNSPNGTPQSRAELQWSTDGSAWSALANVSGSANRVTIPANTLTAGRKLWRVRTYNTDDVASEWSEIAQIVLIGAPVPPAILTLTTAPRAFVRWSSGDQIGWRVVFTDAEGKVFDSGEQYGDAREYRAEGFLADGQAHYSVAVANEYGWSVTEGDFTVENAPSGTISLSAQKGENEALLLWSVSGTFDNLYLLRGGVPIAKVTGLTEYRDRAANGTESYQVLGTVDADYTLSNEAEVSVRVETMSIFDVEGGETVQLRLKRNEAPVVARSKASNVSYYYFAGQELPTAFTDGAASGALSISVTLRREHADDLERFFGKLCCLRDKTGWRGYGVLERIGHSIDRLDDVVLDFALANYSEVIHYD